MRDFDSVFQAIAHRTRREILVFLQRKDRPLSSGEIHARFSCSWPTLCQHLQKLEAAGVIRRQDVGREVHCSVQKQRLVWIVKSWIGYFES